MDTGETWCKDADWIELDRELKDVHTLRISTFVSTSATFVLFSFSAQKQLKTAGLFWILVLWTISIYLATKCSSCAVWQRQSLFYKASGVTPVCNRTGAGSWRQTGNLKQEQSVTPFSPPTDSTHTNHRMEWVWAALTSLSHVVLSITELESNTSPSSTVTDSLFVCAFTSYFI
jgi:hypothetical protein